MSACVICPTFCSSVMLATIERTRASSAGFGSARAGAFGQVPAAAAPEARSAAARHRNALGRTRPANAVIRSDLEVVGGAEQPLAPVFLVILERRRAVHAVVGPVRRVQQIGNLKQE